MCHRQGHPAGARRIENKQWRERWAVIEAEAEAEVFHIARCSRRRSNPLPDVARLKANPIGPSARTATAHVSSIW